MFSLPLMVWVLICILLEMFCERNRNTHRKTQLVVLMVEYISGMSAGSLGGQIREENLQFVSNDVC